MITKRVQFLMLAVLFSLAGSLQASEFAQQFDEFTEAAVHVSNADEARRVLPFPFGDSLGRGRVGALRQ